MTDEMLEEYKKITMRLITLTDHKNYQIEENRKISARVDELESLIDVLSKIVREQQITMTYLLKSSIKNG